MEGEKESSREEEKGVEKKEKKKEKTREIQSRQKVKNKRYGRSETARSTQHADVPWVLHKGRKRARVSLCLLRQRCAKLVKGFGRTDIMHA